MGMIINKNRVFEIGFIYHEETIKRLKKESGHRPLIKEVFADEGKTISNERYYENIDICDSQLYDGVVYATGFKRPRYKRTIEV